MSKAIPAKSRPPVGTQELMRAVEEGDATLVKSLLEAGTDVNAVSEGGKTALMRATSRGYLNVVRVLLDAGADVNAKKENGNTALIMAVFFGYTDIVWELLASGADPAVRTPQGTTPEMWAETMGFNEIAQLLRDADAIRAQGHGDESAPPDAEQADAAGLFPAAGLFKSVVPLSEVDETPISIETATSEKAVAARVEAREVTQHEIQQPVSTEIDEATIVPPRVSPPPPPRAPRTPFAARFASAAHSWPVIVLTLALSLIAGAILEAHRKNSMRSATTEQPATSAAAVPPSADVKAPATQPARPAPQISEAPASGSVARAPLVSSDAPLADADTRAESKPVRARRDEAASEPAGGSADRRPPEIVRAARRDAATETRAGRRPALPPAANEKAAVSRTGGAAPANARSIRRGQSPEGRVLTSSSSSPAHSSATVLSPARRSAKPGHREVIPWP